MQLTAVAPTDTVFQMFGWNGNPANGHILDILPDANTVGLWIDGAGTLNIEPVVNTAPSLVIKANGGAGLLTITGDGKVGLFAATPVVQQANASAAGVSGIAAGAAYAQADMVAVKAALTAIRSALATNGLLANTA